MPVVTVVAPAHPAVAVLLRGVAEAVATALALGDGDVIAAHVPSGATVVSGLPARTSGEDAPWVLVTIHGSDRGRENLESARREATAAVRTWARAQGTAIGGVWAEWTTPQPDVA